MDIITGEVITTQSISGDVLLTQEISGNVNLPTSCGATTWQELTLKPFETLGTDFYVDESGVLHVNGGGTSSNAVWYPTVSDDGDISWVKSDSETAPTPKNIKGPKGADGKSAYEVAVANGYVGTQSEWLASLNGNDGYSPTIAVYENTDTSYVLVITTANGSYYTPNLKGAGGRGFFFILGQYYRGYYKPNRPCKCLSGESTNRT